MKEVVHKRRYTFWVKGGCHLSVTEERGDLAIGHVSLTKAKRLSKIARNRVSSFKNSPEDIFDQNQAETIK